MIRQGVWQLPSGRIWGGTAMPLDGTGSTNDQGCVAIYRHEDGRVSVADSKLDLDKQSPLTFTPQEWGDFEAAVREHRI